MQIAPLNIVKYTWSDTFKAGNYMIKDDTRKDIESTSMNLEIISLFLGMVICLHLITYGIW